MLGSPSRLHRRQPRAGLLLGRSRNGASLRVSDDITPPHLEPPAWLGRLSALLVVLLALLYERLQLAADLGGDALEIPLAEGDQAHRGGRDDVGRALAASEHPHLPEDIARAQRRNHLAVLDHVGG